MIEVIFDKELDKEVYLDFADFSMAGADFGARIRQDHPEINHENFAAYVDRFYEANREELDRSADELRRKLNETQQAFFSAAREVFGVDYSNLKSVGVLSIFDCNPRYPEKNLFQVYYRRDLLGKMEVAYHETLHFMFFRFCSEECADIIGDRDPNQGVYWELSELFNVIILNQPVFRGILKREELLFYPDLSDKLVVLKGLWVKREGNVRAFVADALQELEKTAG